MGTKLTDAFVGRVDVLRVLHTALDDAVAGTGRLVLIAGEAGMGKTRTAEQLATSAQARAAQVIWSRCYEGEGAPAFWPWIEILRAAVPLLHYQVCADIVRSNPELVHLLPGLRDAAPEMAEASFGDSVEIRFRLFDAVASLLSQLALTTPLVIIIDDLQGADRSSLLLLEFISRALRQMRVLVVVTYRNVGARSDHGLNLSLTQLVREPSTLRIDLRGLSREEIAHLVEVRTGARPPDALVARLYERTDGNPLFVTEFVRVIAEPAKALSADSGTSVPEGVRAVIEQRLAPLSARCRGVLRAASVIGRPFSLAVLEQVARRAGLLKSGDRMEVEQILEEAHELGVVDRSSDDPRKWAFAHALLREALYDALRGAMREEVHRHVGEVLEARLDANDHLAEIAHHFRAANDTEKAIAAARRAARQAMDSFAYEEAARLYESALTLLTDSSDAHEPTRCALLIDLGIAQGHSGELDASERTLLRAAEIAKRLGLREQLSAAALHFGTKAVWGELILDHTAMGLLEDAIAVWEENDSAFHSRLLARLSFALQSSDDIERRSYVSRRAVEMARRLDDAALIAESLHAWLSAHWRPDNANERVTLSNEMLRRAEQVHDIELVSLAHSWRHLNLVEIGDWPAGKAAMLDCERLLDSLRDPLHRWWREGMRVRAAIHEGRFPEAERLALECLSLEQSVSRGPPIAFIAHMGRIWLSQGKRDVLETMFERSKSPEFAVPYHYHHCLLAYLAAELERYADARAEFEQLAAHEFADLPQNMLWFHCMRQLAEVCVFLNDVRRADLLVRLLTPYETRIVIDPVTKIYMGAVSHSIALLEAMLLRWEDAEQRFHHAMEMNRQAGARPLVARTQYEYGRILLARGNRGDRERAATLLASASAIAHELDMPMLAERVARLSAKTSECVVSHGRTAGAHRRAVDTIFRREGQFWTVAYAGQVVRVKDSKGMQYVAHLLSRPGQEILALDLAQQSGRSARGADEKLAIDNGGLAALDAQAKQEYRQRWRELRQELAEAEEHNDLGSAGRLKEELDFLTQQLNAAVDLHGKDRKSGAAAERARLLVTKRIKSALKSLDTLHPQLAHHLRACVKTGYYCVYTPPPGQPFTWQTSD